HERLKILRLAVSSTGWHEIHRRGRWRWRRPAFGNRPQVRGPWTRIDRDAKGARPRIDRVLGRIVQRQAGARDRQIGGGEIDTRASLIAPRFTPLQIGDLDDKRRRL